MIKYICIKYKGGFPLGEMNGDFAAKFIWACAFLFVYSLDGEIFLFKKVKMDLTNSRRKNSPQLFDQSKRKYISIFAFSANTFQSDKIEDDCQKYEQYPYPDVLSTLCHCSRVIYITYNSKFCMASPEAVT